MLVHLFLGLWLALLQPVLGDADFLSVRTSLNTDYSGFQGQPGSKYFHEAKFHYHYDGRFADKTIPDDKRHPYLTALAKSYLSMMADVGAETWIMHGSLLGWWWNQKIMPWDSDLDVQVSETTLHFLAQYYNMTEYHFDVPGVPDGRTFLLEINPNFVSRTFEDKANKIDARWIDTDSGLFIDITCVRKDYEERAKGNKGALFSKDKHRYQEEAMFPLRDSYFEGMPVKIPYDYKRLLVEEYGEKSITNTFYHNHQFSEETKEWEYVPPPPKEEEKKD